MEISANTQALAYLVSAILFTTAGWLHATEIAAIATDTWGFEVRPNEFDEAFRPDLLTLTGAALAVAGTVLMLRRSSWDSSSLKAT